MNCEKCKCELKEENLCCDGGTCCKACCDCKDEKTEDCSGCGCHCS